ncbi:hypothetical protein Scep_009672 [Stephania cephalantha]|uniref:Uncharacterized protein n=1 Tax=Stephania cephalantha TaxID=152367 RepID=A0AAP0PGH4_9MAGN
MSPFVLILSSSAPFALATPPRAPSWLAPSTSAGRFASCSGSSQLLPSRVKRIELTQLQPNTPIGETELYLSVVERDDKGRTYRLGWIPSGSRCRHATVGAGAGGGDGAGSSRPISSPNEPIELLRWDFKEMQRHILQFMQDHTLTHNELLEVQ